MSKVTVWLEWRDLDGSEGLGKQTGQSIRQVLGESTYDEAKEYLRRNLAKTERLSGGYKTLEIHDVNGRLMSYVL